MTAPAAASLSPSLMPPIASAASVTASAAFSTIGTNCSPMPEPATVIFLMAPWTRSEAVVVSSLRSETNPLAESSDCPRSSRFTRPLLAASTKAMAALEPNRSMASCVALACLSGSCRSATSWRSLSERFVFSLAQLAAAFLSPVSIWSAGTPAASKSPSSLTPSWSVRPISRRVEPLELRSAVSVCALMPVAVETWAM